VTRSAALNVGKYVLGLSLLGYVVWDDRAQLLDTLTRPLNLGAWALTAIFVSLSALTTFVRWFVLVRAQELPFTLREAVRLGMIAYFFNAVLPSAIGGDLVKAVGLARRQSRRTVAVATVFADRFIGLWGIAWLISLLGAVYWLIGVDLHPRLVQVVEIAWTVLGGSIAGWIVIGFLPDSRSERFAERLQNIPKIGGSLAEAWRAIWMYRRKPRAVLTALGLSFVSQMLYVMCFFNAAHVTAGPDPASVLPTWVEHSLFVPLGMIAQAIFPSPGGIGGSEFAFGEMYQMIGHKRSFGSLGMMVLRFTTWAVALVFYIVGTQTRTGPSTAEPTMDFTTE
jgi:uncharacterized membrane protein YbhN (UPF0104 family)